MLGLLQPKGNQKLKAVWEDQSRQGWKGSAVRGFPQPLGWQEGPACRPHRRVWGCQGLQAGGWSGHPWSWHRPFVLKGCGLRAQKINTGPPCSPWSASLRRTERTSVFVPRILTEGAEGRLLSGPHHLPDLLALLQTFFRLHSGRRALPSCASSPSLVLKT